MIGDVEVINREHDHWMIV